MPTFLENSVMVKVLEKIHFHSNPPKKPNAKNVQTTIQLWAFHILPGLCSKSFKLGFNSMWTKNFLMYKLDLENSEESGFKLPTYVESQKK